MLDSTHAAARRAARLGFSLALLSAAGQTYFIGLSGAALRSEFGLAADGLGLVYGLATLCSGSLMLWLGAWVDRHPPGRMLMLALGLLSLGALLLAASTAAWMLLPALILLRLGGQGLAGHLAIVIAVRHGGAQGGRAAARASMGFIAAEAVFPWLVAAVLGHAPWRVLWLVVGVLLLVAMLPLKASAAQLPPPEPAAMREGTPDRLGRRQVLRSPLFIGALGIVLLNACTVTAVFLHQGSLAEAQAWPITALPMAFMGFALAQALANASAGRFVDRHGVFTLLRLYLLPLACGVLLIAFVPGTVGLLLSFVLLGLSAGCQGVVGAALWLRLFGAHQLGLVRGLYAAMMVYATAVAPWVLGGFLSAQFDLRLLAGFWASVCLLLPWMLTGWLQRRCANPAPASSADAGGP